MSVDLGTIIEDLILAEGQMRAMRVEIAKKEELLVTSRLIITQLQQENAELRRHLNPAPAGPITEAEIPY